jgi:hypothetical protein
MIPMGERGRRAKGASRRGYLEHADSDGLVGAGDADEGLDRLLRRPHHGGNTAAPVAVHGDATVTRSEAGERRGEGSRSRSSGAVRVNSSAADVVAPFSRGPWAGLNATDGENDFCTLASSGEW